MKTIGILAHSDEGGALCFITACREGRRTLGEHHHPDIVLSAIPMSLSMPGWNNNDHELVAGHLSRGVDQLKAAGADFFICPDNTAHIVLEPYMERMALPGLHIAQVVCHEIKSKGWKKAALLGTNWTMTGPVYARIMEENGIERLIPEEATRQAIHHAIFSELCNGDLRQETTELFIAAIEDLKARGAECVILGCTEIPLIITPENSPLPTLDSTRLLASYAVKEAIETNASPETGWLKIN